VHIDGAQCSCATPACLRQSHTHRHTCKHAVQHARAISTPPLRARTLAWTYPLVAGEALPPGSLSAHSSASTALPAAAPGTAQAQAGASLADQDLQGPRDAAHSSSGALGPTSSIPEELRPLHYRSLLWPRTSFRDSYVVVGGPTPESAKAHLGFR